MPVWWEGLVLKWVELVCSGVFPCFRLLAIRMALVLRRSTHIGLDIRGYTVAQWRKREEKKREAKEHLSRSYRSLSLPMPVGRENRDPNNEP